MTTTTTTTTTVENSNTNSVTAWREKRKKLRRKREEDGDGSDDFGFGSAAADAGQTAQTRTQARTQAHTQAHAHTQTQRQRQPQITSNEYVPHVTAAKRLKMEREAILSSVNAGGSDTYDGGVNAGDGFGMSEDGKGSQRSGNARSRKMLAAVGTKAPPNFKDGDEDEMTKMENTNTDGTKPDHESSNNSNNNDNDNDNDNDNYVNEGRTELSLLEQATLLKKKLTPADRILLAQKEEETRILREASKVQTNALQAASELAKGVTYTKSLPTSWSCPRRLLQRGEPAWAAVRKNWHILADGKDCPPPIKSFADMKFPPPILSFLKQRNINRPTPIQMQGLPVALAGRDMVGIAFTGSGKTMTFSLPLVMAALEEEMRMPLVGGEGPVGIIMAPSRELANQTYEIVQQVCDVVGAGGYPQLRAQLEPFKEKGVHCVVATPGRLRDFLKKKSITLDICRFICLDEADRMLDLGFDEEVGEIMNHFTHQRQTLLFSATFPKKFQDFAKSTLVRPVVVNVGRAGAANLDVIQEVEYVKQEAKIVYLLECLQKTAPPVIIFCERKGDVDDIHEYLLLKGVEAVSIHGGKEQEERNEAITLYKEGKKDVLVATDIAAKGLDFADIQHVINFDMPSEIENYVHRIGRTGRCGKTGVATTFINKSCEETTLLDLKHLLKEAHQRIPPVLLIMDDPLENAPENDGTSKGCAFCGGLGHSISDCPKIDKDAKRVTQKDALASGDGYGGEM